MARLRIGELLVSAKVITQDQLDAALKVDRLDGQRIGDLLVLQGRVTENQLTQTLGLQLSVPWVSLYHIDFSRQLLNLVPRDVAEKFCLVPIFVRRVKKQGDTLYVAMDDPTNEAALIEVMTYAGLPAKPMIASPTDIRGAIRVYYGAEVDPSGVPAAGPPVQVPTVAPPAVASPSVSHVPLAPPSPSPKVSQKPPLPVRAAKTSGPATSTVPSATSVVAGPPAAAAMATPVATSAATAPAANGATTSTPPMRAPMPSSGDSPDAAPEIEAREVSIPLPKRGGLPMVALTMLDGTTIHLPARKKPQPTAESDRPAPAEELLTARDLIRALRAVAQGADASAVLGEDTRWETLFAALLSLLLKKGIVSDWEFIDELRATNAAAVKARAGDPKR